jgi:Family of unknown function (DUF5687)
LTLIRIENLFMFKKFIYLESKSFFRSSSVGTDLFMKGLIWGLVLFYGILLLTLGINSFYELKKMNLNPLILINKYLIYYFSIDLIIRLLMQNIPVMNIRNLLILPIKKTTVIHYSILKTVISYFNWLHAMFFMPFSIVLVLNGYPVLNVFSWLIGLLCIIYINNFLNIILNNKTSIFYVFGLIVVGLAVCQYYKWFDITIYSLPFFSELYESKWLYLLLILILFSLYFYTSSFFKKDLYLDAGLSIKQKTASTENLTFLNQFGTLGSFLKNDIRLIKRNKRTRATVILSIVFLFYGIFFFKENSNQPIMLHVFAGIVVSGGFLFTFGQFVPSWDSSYYPFMMTQNIHYKTYLSSKWWLIIIATIISTIVASFYLYFSWHAYMSILIGAIYNIGINSHLIMLSGAYKKTPVDLGSSMVAFGTEKSFNIQAVILLLPKILLPVGLYLMGEYFRNANTGFLFVGLFGILGLAFRNKIFTMIEKVYKLEKYKTINAYKEKK